MPAVERPAKRQTNQNSPTGPDAAADIAVDPAPTGKLEWRRLLDWLSDDDLIESEDAERTIKRFGSAHSAQHPHDASREILTRGSCTAPAEVEVTGMRPIPTTLSNEIDTVRRLKSVFAFIVDLSVYRFRMPQRTVKA